MISSDFKQDDQLLVIKVKGDILSTNAEERADQIGSIFAEFPDFKKVKLDLNTAKMVDSVGLNMLLGVIKTVVDRGAEIVLHISSPSIHRVFLMSRFDKLANIHFREKRSRK